MSKSSGRTEPDDRRRPQSAIRLPTLSGGEEIGLGDVIGRVTSAVRITPCAGCARRAQVLNRWVGFTPRAR